jgi:tRNA G18 (ribose-2'-O)-methylase SpoU
VNLATYERPEKLVLLLGEEIHGITPELLDLCDDTLEIPMVGRKESFNVSVATGIALYALSA